MILLSPGLALPTGSKGGVEVLIKSSEFKGAFVDWNRLPEEDLPEIALVGLSLIHI